MMFGGLTTFLFSCGTSYFLTIVDDCSKGVWVHLMDDKIEVRKILKTFCTMVETQFNKLVKCVRS